MEDTILFCSLVHSHLVEECRGSALIGPEMLLHQLTYAIKNQLVASKADATSWEGGRLWWIFSKVDIDYILTVPAPCRMSPQPESDIEIVLRSK